MKSCNILPQPIPFWPYMTEKQTNRFTDFTFDFLDDREVRRKKTKNRFHHHGQIIARLYGARIKHLTNS